MDSKTTLSRKEILLGAVLATALATVFAYNVYRFNFLCDDSFISFRYALHLAEGEGLVWNPGERVEGYTNFLWVLLLAAGLKVGVVPELLSRLLNTFAGTALIVALTVFSARRYGRRSPFVWLVPLVLALSPSFTGWCTGGLEIMSFTALLFFAYASFLREREKRPDWPVVSSTLFALASLLRPEGALFVTVAGIFFCADLVSRRRRIQEILLWAAPYVVLVGAHLLWRHAYYGFWLPNTFYAKVNGVWWERGFGYFLAFDEVYKVVWFLPLLILALVSRPRYEHLLFVAATVPYCVYIASIGGDWIEFRFLVVVFPYFYLLVADGLARLVELCDATRARTAGRVLAVGWAVALLVTTALGDLGKRPMEEQFLKLKVSSTRFLQSYVDLRAPQGIFLRQLVDEGLLPEDLVLCVGGAGALPYYARLKTVDRLGLNDTYIAHLEVEERGRLGHEHDAPLEYLRRRGVIIFDELNSIVYAERVDPESQRMRRMRGGRDLRLPLRTVRAKDRYLIFSTLVPEEEFRRIFRRLEIVE